MGAPPVLRGRGGVALPGPRGRCRGGGGEHRLRRRRAARASGGLSARRAWSTWCRWSTSRLGRSRPGRRPCWAPTGAGQAGHERRAPKPGPSSGRWSGPESWATVAGVEWCWWDLWFCVLAVADFGGDLDRLEADLVGRLRSPGWVGASRSEAEAKLSHLADLRAPWPGRASGPGTSTPPGDARACYPGPVARS